MLVNLAIAATSRKRKVNKNQSRRNQRRENDSAPVSRTPPLPRSQRGYHGLGVSSEDPGGTIIGAIVVWRTGCRAERVSHPELVRSESKGEAMKLSGMKLVAATFVLVIGVGAVQAQGTSDSLIGGFQDPPESARPRVWWHWMNGNITKEGIKLDLEWMHRVGLAGFQNFDAALSTPQVVDQRLAYMTPEWKDAFKYATTLADQLGMEEAIAGSPGWSESGGPWVPASQGMKKYVWSETFVEGGKPFTGTLAHPPSNTGPFQSIDIRSRGARFRSFTPMRRSSPIAGRPPMHRAKHCMRRSQRAAAHWIQRCSATAISRRPRSCRSRALVRPPGSNTSSPRPQRFALSLIQRRTRIG